MPTESEGPQGHEPQDERPSPYQGLTVNQPPYSYKGEERRARPRTRESLAQTAYLNGIRRIYNENAGNPDFQDSFARFLYEERLEGQIITPSLLKGQTPEGDIPYSHKLEINAIKLAAAEARTRAAEMESMTDPLTGALNRRGLERQLEIIRESVSSTGRTSTLVQLDLDHFKGVNDTIGHDGGDIALIGTVRYLQEQLGPNVKIARAGGEEFYALFVDNDTTETRERLEEIRPGLRPYLAEQLLSGGKKQGDIARLALTASYGIAAFTSDTSIENVKRSTDIALYAAKESGRDRIMSITDADVSRIDTSGIALRDIQEMQDRLEQERRHPPTPPGLILGGGGNSPQQ